MAGAPFDGACWARLEQAGFRSVSFEEVGAAQLWSGRRRLDETDPSEVPSNAQHIREEHVGHASRSKEDAQVQSRFGTPTTLTPPTFSRVEQEVFAEVRAKHQVVPLNQWSTCWMRCTDCERPLVLGACLRFEKAFVLFKLVRRPFATAYGPFQGSTQSLRRTFKCAEKAQSFCEKDELSDGLWRADVKCIGLKAKDADLWILNCEEVRRIQEGTSLEIKHIEAFFFPPFVLLHFFIFQNFIF